MVTLATVALLGIVIGGWNTTSFGPASMERGVPSSSFNVLSPLNWCVLNVNSGCNTY